MTHAHPATAHDSDHLVAHQELDSDSQAEILELDAEVLTEHTASIMRWLPIETTPRQIVDLGCGTGAGTFALLARFPDAEVTAVDASASHLVRLRERAEAEGAAERVRTVLADLDGDWPDLGHPQLVWASASLHHLSDPDNILRQVYDGLARQGLLAVVELADFPRFLPPDAPAGRPGLEDRCHASIAQHHAGHVSHRGADWGPKLTAAGFTVVAQRTITVDIDGSSNPAVGRYAVSSLGLLRGSAANVLDAADLVALDDLLDATSPGSILRRRDLALRTERVVWTARRS